MEAELIFPTKPLTLPCSVIIFVFEFIILTALIYTHNTLHIGLVRSADGKTVQGDIPFVPEILFEGTYRPICANDFAGNREGAAAVCRELGFDNGAFVKVTNAKYEQDAVAVGRCKAGERIDECTGGGNSLTLESACGAGKSVGMEITCHYKCRKFPAETLDELHFPNCLPYIDVEKTYLIADTIFYDDNSGESLASPGFSLFSQLTMVLNNAMNPTCAQNAIQSICQSSFKECREVEEGIFVPALLCREECQKYKTKWDECLDDIEAAGEMKSFSTQMAGLTSQGALGMKLFFQLDLPPDSSFQHQPFALPKCDVEGGDPSLIMPGEASVAFFNGYLAWPEEEPFRHSLFWPTGTVPGPYFPKEFSQYTSYDGITRDVKCYIPDEVQYVAKFDCPAPYKNPIDKDYAVSCIKPCPVNAYSDDEYSTMWLIVSLVGLGGFILNVFMVATWQIDKKKSKALPYQLKSCAGFGISYGIVETLPVRSFLPSTRPSTLPSFLPSFHPPFFYFFLPFFAFPPSLPPFLPHLPFFPTFCSGTFSQVRPTLHEPHNRRHRLQHHVCPEPHQCLPSPGPFFLSSFLFLS
jgi:hypothetical protein